MAVYFGFLHLLHRDT